MDHEKLPELDDLLARVRGSALKSLTAVIDVEERLQAIHRACAADRDVDARAAAETSAGPR
jgi:hypothetical protein